MTLAHRSLAAALGIALLGASLPLARAQDAKDDVKAIEKEFQDEVKALREATQKAADRDAAAEMYKDFQEKIMPEFAARYAAIGRAHPGGDDALEAWCKVLELASQGLGGALPGEALDALTRDHLKSEKLESVAGMLRWDAESVGEERAIQALRAMAEGSPHRKVQATALLSLGTVLGKDGAADDAQLAEALRTLGRLASYTDVEERGLSFADAGAKLAFALQNLRTGKPCPDFKAVDAEGAGFKLSDYKGKVVMVDFWGFW